MKILKIMDDMQRARGKNRLIIILDGMGTAIVKNLLPSNGFFGRHLTGSARAIIPATTVAATTAYRTGKMPCDTGFIGWSQYFAETDEVIEVFLNTNYYTGQKSKLSSHPYSLPCKTVVERMNNSGRSAFEFMPAFMPGGCATFDQWLSRIIETCNRETDTYVYAYWAEPDSSMHKFGTRDNRVRDLLRDMEKKLANALAQIKNTTEVLITADHGHRDIEYFYLSDFPDVEKCLAHPLSLEARCASLFVRPDCLAQFPTIFNKHFGANFKLVPKYVFERDYLHASHTIKYIGDYVALATGGYALTQKPKDESRMKSNHAGITKEEMEIPLIRMTLPALSANKLKSR